MENTPKKVAKPGLQLVISILVATSLILAELYVMINQPANIVLLVGIAILVLIAVYFVIDAVLDCQREREIALKEQYDNLYRSERASYKLLKKKMEEFSEIIQAANQEDNSEDIIQAQKALAKISVSKNRESAEMIIARLAKLEDMLESGLASVKASGVDDEKQDRLFIELNNLEASLSDRMQGLSYKLSGFQEEIERLADHIAKINSEAIQTAINANAAQVNVAEPVVGLEKEIVLLEDIPAVEVTDDIEFTELNMGGIEIVSEAELGMSAFADEDVSEDEEDIFSLEDTMDDVFAEDLSDIEIPDVSDAFEESDEDVLSQLLEVESSISEDEVDALAELAKAIDEEPTPAPVEEKKPTPPSAPADNGGKMGQDDIAALIASMTGGGAAPAPAPVEEKKPTPPSAPADNGGKMGQDDIAALIASMTGGDAVPAPAPVEEKKPTPPPAPADNGGKMNQDDIAALIASMTGN